VWGCTLLEGSAGLTPCEPCDGPGSSDDSGAGVADQGGTAPGEDSGSGGTGDSGAGSDSAATDSGAGSDSGTDGGKDAAPSTIASLYAAAVELDSPIGYWPLGDPTTSSTCHDASGKNHDGVLNGPVTLGATGPFTDGSITAATFDADPGDYIDLGGTFNFSGTSPFSWEIWVKPAVLPGSPGSFMSAMQFDGAGAPSTGEYLIAYSDNGQTLGFEMYNNGDGFITNEVGGDGGLFVGEWSYVVATWNGSDAGDVYINGVSYPSEPNDADQVPTLVVDTLIGQFFDGTIGEVAIYDHALTAGQVQAHWLAGTTKP
jgi:hypothetical protein